MEKRHYYFAYGSNMDSARMLGRCRGARFAGVGMLADYRLVERLYADIERARGCCTPGVLWSVTEADLRRLDGFEGVPRGVYERRVYRVNLGGAVVRAYGYEMTAETRRVREGRRYPAEYRRVCSNGAVRHGVVDLFGSVKKGA